MTDQNGNDTAQAQPLQAPDPLSATQQEQDLKKTKYSEKIEELEQLLDQHEREVNQLSRLRRTQERIHELDSQSEEVNDIFAMMSAFNSTLLAIEENVNRICQLHVPQSPGNTSSPDSQSQVDEILAMLAAFNSTMSFIRETLNGELPNRSIQSESESPEESQVESMPNSSPTSSRQSLSDEQMAEFSDVESTSGGKEEKICGRCQTYELTYECSSCMTQWYCRKLCQLCWMESHRKHCG